MAGVTAASDAELAMESSIAFRRNDWLKSTVTPITHATGIKVRENMIERFPLLSRRKYFISLVIIRVLSCA